MNINLKKLQTGLSSAILNGDVDCVGISTDSRKIIEGNLFVALKGENFDAHLFLEEVKLAGASAVVAEYVPKDFDLPSLIVPDTKLALSEMASMWRRQFNIPVIAVAGSNGKTTVKEMIASIFMAHFGKGNFVSTQGNLNNEIGVPLTIFNLAEHHQGAVIELGMNHPGEIEKLTSMAMPTVALVNNAQREHQEFMKSVQAVAEENGEVFKSLHADGVAVFPYGDSYSPLWNRLAHENGQRKVCTFGTSKGADVLGTAIEKQFGCELSIQIQEEKLNFNLHAAGKHNVLNALAAAACCHSIGIPLGSIAKGLELFQPVSGRLQLKNALNGAKIIDDTYNANPDSVIAAIAVLKAAGENGVLVLGDMGEVGKDGAQYHAEIGQYALENGIGKLFTLGELSKHSSDVFGKQAQHFSNVDELITELKEKILEDSTVLIKGSRFMKMERVVNSLMIADQKMQNEKSLTGNH